MLVKVDPKIIYIIIFHNDIIFLYACGTTSRYNNDLRLYRPEYLGYLSSRISAEIPDFFLKKKNKKFIRNEEGML